MNVVLPIYLFYQIRIAVSRRANAIAWFSVPPLMYVYIERRSLIQQLIASRDFIPIGFIIWQSSSSFSNAPSGTGLVGFIVALHSSLCWDLIYPTIPCLRPTALSYATGGLKDTGQGSSGGSRGYPGGYASGHSRRANKSGTFPSSHSKGMDADEVPLRPIPSREGHYASASAGYEGDGASGNSRSIHVTQEYHVVTK